MIVPFLHRLDTNYTDGTITATCSCGRWSGERTADGKPGTLTREHKAHADQSRDGYVLALCTDTEGRLVRDVTVPIREWRKLGCGCVRIVSDRPGPGDGPLAGALEFLVQRCPFHQANEPDDEPTAVHA
jgi:hypothetical protein